MINTSKKIVFFGTDEFSLVILKALVNAGYHIDAVVTQPDRKSGRGQRMTSSPVKKFALEQQLDVWQPIKIGGIDQKLKDMNGDVIGILASYGKIIPQETIDLFKPGIVNVHPSLLPKYRGPTPIESAIENGDDITGVSIILLTSKMDAGPIYSQAKYSLLGNENQAALHETLADLGAHELIKILPDIISGSLEPKPQDEAKATYCKLLTKKNQLLSPDKISAEQAEKQVRAHLVYPKTKIKVANCVITILDSHVSDVKTGPLDILFSVDSKYLSIDKLIAPSGRIMSKKDFINGYLAKTS